LDPAPQDAGVTVPASETAAPHLRTLNGPIDPTHVMTQHHHTAGTTVILEHLADSHAMEGTPRGGDVGAFHGNLSQVTTVIMFIELLLLYRNG
jgi:hypothetical protein